MKKLLKEFKTFITRGNVFDMAVGLIIATAFNKIVSSMVNDLLMPLITWATGNASLSEMSIVLRVAEDGTELLWKYGSFLQTVIDFLIIAISVFTMIKIVNHSRELFDDIGDFLEKESKKEIRAEKKLVRRQAKEQGKSFKELWTEREAEKKRMAEEKARILAEEKARKEQEEKLKNPTQEMLLTEIRDLLKEEKSSKKSK